MANPNPGNARRAQIKAGRIARYLAIGGPDMPNAEAARIIGVAVATIGNYRAELLAAGKISAHLKGPPPVAPCGTPGAYRRHYRHGEKACTVCAAAESLRRGQVPAPRPDYRDKRNNIPERPYTWRSQRYRWAEQALARAEAVWGTPDDEAIAS